MMLIPICYLSSASIATCGDTRSASTATSSTSIAMHNNATNMSTTKSSASISTHDDATDASSFQCCGEGGEHETLVLDCPLRESKLVVDGHDTMHLCDECSNVGNDDGIFNHDSLVGLRSTK